MSATPRRRARGSSYAASIEKLLAYRDVSVVTLDGMVYDGSTGSALAFTFQSAGAAQYLKDLGAKTRRGLRGAHREGNSTGGRCFGFDVDGRASTTRTVCCATSGSNWPSSIARPRMPSRPGSASTRRTTRRAPSLTKRPATCSPACSNAVPAAGSCKSAVGVRIGTTVASRTESAVSARIA
jgi:hypothetical protein